MKASKHRSTNTLSHARRDLVDEAWRMLFSYLAIALGGAMGLLQSGQFSLAFAFHGRLVHASNSRSHTAGVFGLHDVPGDKALSLTSA